MTYSAAVITVSDKGSKGERVDTSGPMLVGLLKERGYEVLYTNIVPDDRDVIKTELIKCCDDIGVSLVLTTGGTGFAKRDITPEATMDIIDRETAGIPEMMRAESAKITNRACLSRSKAGIRKDTLIINLPGSQKAAKENFEAIADALDHGLDMLASFGSADCAQPVNEQVYMSASTQSEFISESDDIASNLAGDESLLTDMIFNDNADISDKEYAEKIVDALWAKDNSDKPEIKEDESMGQLSLDDQAIQQDKDAAVEPMISESSRPSVLAMGANDDTEKIIVPERKLKAEYFAVPDNALVKSQTYNGKKIPPKMDDWMREAKADINAPKCGMYLTHNGVVRIDARAKVRGGIFDANDVTGMELSYITSEVNAAIADTYQMDGIYFIKVWLNEGDLDVGDDIMYVLIGGDIRANVVDALQYLVGRIKDSCVKEIEKF